MAGRYVVVIIVCLLLDNCDVPSQLSELLLHGLIILIKSDELFVVADMLLLGSLVAGSR